MPSATTAAASSELTWLLNEIHSEINGNVSIGLEECLGRLCEHSPFKLVMSSAHNELLKGTVTRTGSCIAEAELLVRFSNAHNRPLAVKLTSPVYLSQIVDSSGCISEAVQVVSKLDADAKSANSTQLHLQTLLQLVQTALNSLRNPSPTLKFPLYITDLTAFRDLPETVSVAFYIADSSVVVEVHSFEEESVANSGIHTIFKRRGQLKVYDGGNVFDYEAIVVESQDPNLISVTAKLTALETHLQVLNRKLTLCRMT